MRFNTHFNEFLKDFSSLKRDKGPAATKGQSGVSMSAPFRVRPALMQIATATIAAAGLMTACGRSTPVAPSPATAQTTASGLRHLHDCEAPGSNCVECIPPNISCVPPGTDLAALFEEHPDWCQTEIPICQVPTLDDQAITFTSTPPSPALVGGSYIVTANATSGLQVSFSTLTPLICSVTGSSSSFLAAGQCQIAANQEGNVQQWNPAPQVVQSFSVLTAGTGFLPPIANPPAANHVNAGQTIPVKFSLGGDLGLTVFADGSPASAPCVSGPSEPAETAGKSGLHYDAASGTYNFLWQTKKEWTGTCRRLTVTLNGGGIAPYEAVFIFR